MSAPDGAWARELATTFGIVEREVLHELGVTSRQIDRRLATGLLVAAHDGVYRHAAAPVSWEGRLLAALLAAGPDAFASHHAAMRLHGIRGVWDDTPEVTVVGTVKPRLSGVRVHRIDRLDDADRHRRLGIPVLSPPLALLTLGSRAGHRAVENAMHHMVKLHRTTRPKLYDVLDRYGGRGRRGATAYRLAVAALPASGAVTDSGLELDMLRLLRAAGLSDPTLQHPVYDPRTAFCARLDLAYVHARLDLETDGDLWHTSASARRRDARRDAALARLGWRVERFDSGQVHEQAAASIDRVRAALATPARSLSA